MPSPDELAHYYDRVYAYSDAEFAQAVDRSYLRELQRVADVVGPGRGRLLEVGANTGLFLAALRDRGWHVGGVELGARFRDAARARGLDVRPTLAEWAGDEFDAVVSFHLLEHVPDPLAELRRTAALLRPGGKLLLKTPNVDSVVARVFPGEWEWSSPPAHVHLFSRSSLRHALEVTGLEPLAMATGSGNARPFLFQALRAIGIRLRGEAGRYTPGLDERHVPVAHRGWYRAVLAGSRFVSVLGWPLAALLGVVGLMPELTVVARRHPLALAR